MKDLNIIIQALNKANQNGVFTLEESKLIADTLISFKESLTNDEYIKETPLTNEAIESDEI